MLHILQHSVEITITIPRTTASTANTTTAAATTDNLTTNDQLKLNS